jgi:acyl carrier protein
MDPALAVMALGQAVDGPDSVLAVMDADWAQFAAAPAPLLRDLPVVTAHATRPGAGPAALTQDGLARQLSGLPPARQVQVLADLVQASAAAVLGHADPGAIQPGRAFTDLGFDSLTSLEMRHQLTALTGLRLPATILFDYPTPDALARYLQAEASAAVGGEAAAVLAELDRLDALLSALPGGHPDRDQIAARLAALSQSFRAAADSAPAPDIAAATNDEMFQLIEKELTDTELEW